MIQTTCLILEPSDFTSDLNLRKEAFDALMKAPVVISGGALLKAPTTQTDSKPKDAPPKRTRKPKTVIVEPVAEQKEPLTSGMATP